MNNDLIDHLLGEASLRPSPVRRLTLRLLEESTRPVSALDIEMALETVDRSSISRTLTAFTSAGIVHVIDDGSGSTKYELCRHSGDDDNHSDLHPHFHCLECGRTICLTSVAVPPMPLPEGFEARTANYVIKGICDRCSAKIKTK